MKHFVRERTERPVIDHDVSHESIMVNEVNMDFRIPGLPHSVVKHAQSTSVRELIQKIENHPNRDALQQDLRQNQAYDPFSPESKQMIHDVGNVQLFELLETDSKTQCKACLSYCSEGVVCCTCGHLLQETVASRGKKKHYEGIHDRFLRDDGSRRRMIENNRDEEVCRAWDVLADEDHTYHMSQEEYFYYRNSWWLHLNKSGNDTQPLRKRSDFETCVVYIKAFTPRSWRRTNRARSLLEVQTMEIGIEFFFYMVAMARFLVVCLTIQRKSRKMRQAKACD